jgi:Low psii accumulation1 / Rep27
MMISISFVVLAAATIDTLLSVSCFQLSPLSPRSSSSYFGTASHGQRRSTNTHSRSPNDFPLFLGRGSDDSDNSSSNKPEYSREILLREEAESPFRKVRFFLYASLGIAALTSLLVSGARIAAGLSGINVDLLDESITNAGVDLLGLVVLGVLWQRDSKAQESRLKRASKGAELAKLKVRASKAMVEGHLSVEGSSDGNEMFTTSLASLRRGRGIEKRVVIAAAGRKKIEQVLEEATRLQGALVSSDLLVVPVVLPQVSPPDFDISKLPECVAYPVGSSWKYVIDDEVNEAVRQGIDVTNDGLCIILKKNGRVGQRTKGVYLQNMVSEVGARSEAGMDIKNI